MPVLILIFAFGLSMDYEVFLLPQPVVADADLSWPLEHIGSGEIDEPVGAGAGRMQQ